MKLDEIYAHLEDRNIFEKKDSYKERSPKVVSYCKRILKRGKNLLKEEIKNELIRMVEGYTWEIVGWDRTEAPIGGNIWLPKEIKYETPEFHNHSPISIAEGIRKDIVSKFPNDVAKYGEWNWSFFSVGDQYEPRVSSITSNKENTLGAFVIEGGSGSGYHEAVYAFKREGDSVKVKLIAGDRSSADRDPEGFFRYLVQHEPITGGRLTLSKLRKPTSNDEKYAFDLVEVLK